MPTSISFWQQPKRFLSRSTVVAAATAAGFAFAPQADAAGVKAGTLVNNVATATYNVGGTDKTIVSNTVSLRVDEVIDVVIVSRDAGDATVTAGATDGIRTFSVTNSGNGPEAFTLHADGTVNGNAFDPRVSKVAIDTNGNGVYDPGVDEIIVSGGTGPTIEPDAAFTVFILAAIPTEAIDGKRGQVSLETTAATGSGLPGTTFPGKGIDGGDAIVGAGHADAHASGGFIVRQASVVLEKAAIVVDPYGGSRTMTGSIITYRLTATITGTGSVPDLHLIDTIPARTAYVPGTLVIDGRRLSDAEDGDEGSQSTDTLEFKLGTASAGAAHIAEFKVTVLSGATS